MIYLSYYLLIIFSILGYGFLLSKILNIRYINFGFLGLIGVTFLTFLSYSTTLFIVHGYTFNLIVLFFGILFFALNFKKKFTSQLFLTIILFGFLILFILVSKNHDDFSYYHFPYSHFLTQFKHPIGFGWVNEGFRNHSSIFFLNSLFYLPYIEHYLLHLSPVFFLGFTNIIFISFIFDKNKFSKYKFINFFSLLCVCFLNIFFYRLAEHGTDRSGQILIFLVVLLIIIIFSEKYKYHKLDLFKISSLTLVLLISLKTFYILYAPLILFIFFHKDFRKKFIGLIIDKSSLFSILFLSLTIFFNFLNTGCLVYPALFTCFDNLYWSFPEKIVLDINQWYEIWSKGGATPAFFETGEYVNNPKEYISGLNWVNNWIDVYFFNKVSDYLLGLLLLGIIFYFTFIFQYKKNKTILFDNKIKALYLFFIFLLVEWFFKHPALRYGGYHLFALILFIPLSEYFQKVNISYKKFTKKALSLLMIVLVIFISRNINRIINENKNYNYNPFVSTKFHYDKKIYNRYIPFVKNEMENYKQLNFFGLNFLITKKNK